MFEVIIKLKFKEFEQIQDTNSLFDKTKNITPVAKTFSNNNKPSYNNYSNTHNNDKRKNNNYSRGNNRVSSLEEDFYYDSEAEAEFGYDQLEHSKSDEDILEETFDDLNALQANLREWKDNPPQTKGCLHKLLYKECNKKNCPFNHDDPKVLSNTCHSMMKSLSESSFNTMYAISVKSVKKEFASNLRFNNVIDSNTNTSRSILRRSSDAPDQDKVLEPPDNSDY